MGIMIETQNLTKKFGDFVANNNINLQVDKQEIKCIVGENGAGKSTLMNMLYGVFKPTSGKVLLKGEELAMNSPTDAIRHGIGMVHQHFKLVPSFTVYENILLGSEITKNGLIDRKQEIEKVRELIEEYHFQIDPMAKIQDISVGLCQQVEILKMLYRNVDILILDEPTAVLTPQEVDQLMENLKALRDQGKTIIVITHKLREVMYLSDSVTVIKAGQVIGNVRTKDTCESELAQMVGRDVVLTVKNEDGPAPKEEEAYRVENVCTVNDANQEILHRVFLSVRKGEVLGIAGVEGNGQSELIKVLTGMMEVTEGKVTLNGRDITNEWPDKLRKFGIGIIPEDRYAQGLCREMSIPENCIAGYFDTHGVCRKGVLKGKSMKQLCDSFIEKYDIRVSERYGLISQLSGRNAQKVIIAREFENNPDLIIACQPTRGVDIGSIEFIHKQLLSLRNAGKAVLLISSELSEIMSLSDRVAVMYKGGIIGEVDPREASSEKIGLLMAGAGQEGGGRNEKQ